MAFVDELIVTLSAGSGGRGVVRWRREKFVQKGGPSGGNGGNGGDVYLEAVSDLTILARYRGHKEYAAERGEDGGSSLKHGKNGNDFVLQVPVGSYVRNQNNNDRFDFTTAGQRVLVLKGGGGGRGNFEFRSSTNVAPDRSTNGGQGAQGTFSIELRLVVDIGLIGLPNAGKSSLLNEITAARAKVAAYPFTTLEPNLGMLGDRVIADIPGLIEGAAMGRGLGSKFLRHIQRTRLIAHCISLEHQDVHKAYRAVRKELEEFGEGLAEKPEIVILTKSDLTDSAGIESATRRMTPLVTAVFVCSVHDYASIQMLLEKLPSLVPSPMTETPTV